jgi:hypothetical protein
MEEARCSIGFVGRLESGRFYSGLRMKSGRGNGASGGSGLPFCHRLPIFLFFFVEFLFPFFLWLFTVSADMAAFMAARALTTLDIIV